MRDLVEEANEFQPGGLPTFWLPPINKSHDLKSDPGPFDNAQSQEYWQRYRTLAGSPFESSDSESDSDCDDDTLSVASFCVDKDVSLINWEGTETTNALGLIFTSGEDDFEAKAVATFTPQAENLRAPLYHQDARSCGHPDQNYHALQERLAFQSDGPTNETLIFQGSYAEPCGPYKDNVYLEDKLDDIQLLRAPRMRYISLPEFEEQEDDEGLFYGGSDLGGWLTGALDGVPETMLADGCLDLGLQVPFAMVE